MLQNMGHVFSPSGKTTSGVRLEIDDDVGQLEVAFLFKVGKHSGAEKDFTLSYSVQVRVQLQSLDLQHKDQSRITITDFIQNEDKISVRSCIFFFFFFFRFTFFREVTSHGRKAFPEVCEASISLPRR